MARSCWILLGPPGCGKGSVAEDLQQHSTLRFSTRITHVNAGQLLRDLADAGDPLGVRLRDEYWAAGNLVPSEEISKLVLNHLNSLQGLPSAAVHYTALHELLLLDGYPRRPDQVEALMASEQKLDGVFVFHAPEDELMVRLLRRGRSDDSAETIRHRLKVYNEETRPSLEYLAKSTKLPIIFVDASGSRLGTMDRVEQALQHSPTQFNSILRAEPRKLR